MAETAHADRCLPVGAFTSWQALDRSASTCAAGSCNSWSTDSLMAPDRAHADHASEIHVASSVKEPARPMNRPEWGGESTAMQSCIRTQTRHSQQRSGSGTWRDWTFPRSIARDAEVSFTSLGSGEGLNQASAATGSSSFSWRVSGPSKMNIATAGVAEVMRQRGRLADRAAV
jgi:hypothetical protein